MTKKRAVAPRPVLARALALAAAFAASLAGAAAPSPPTLSLAAVLDSAAKRSGLLLIKRLDAERQAEAIREAKSRGLPQLSLTGSSSYMTNPPKGFSIKQGAFSIPFNLPAQDVVLVKDTESSYFKFSLQLEQILWTWGKIGKGVRVAELDRANAAISLTAAARELRRDATAAYYGAVLARESVGLLGQAESLLREIEADQEKAYAEGTVTRKDVLEARSRTAALTSQRLGAEQGMESGLDALEYFTGSRPEAVDLVDALPVAAPALDETALKAAALSASTELVMLRNRLRQAELGEEIRKASMIGLPDISLDLSYDLAGQKIPFAAGDWKDSWSGDLIVTLGGKVQLWDSFASLSRLKQSELERMQAQAGEEELVRSMGIKVRRLVEAVKTGAASVDEKRALVDLAKEQARNAQAAFENDLASKAEAKGALVARCIADLELLAARGRLAEALTELEFATAPAP
jgi:outer membrane protein